MPEVVTMQNAPLQNGIYDGDHFNLVIQSAPTCWGIACSEGALWYRALSDKKRIL